MDALYSDRNHSYSQTLLQSSATNLFSRILSLFRTPSSRRRTVVMPASKVFETAGPDGPTLHDAAELIKQGKAKNIIVLVGAGISTSAGIPDFRSPETGLYSNLAKYNLPYAEAIFDISYFLQRPEAFFALAKEIYPGNYLPTITHYFFVLMHKKGFLKRLFTQNVDTLERQAGLPGDAIVEAHGSFATAHCLNCRQEYQAEELRPRIAKGEVIRCDKPACKKTMKGLIKSDIVFFGESLPATFFQRLSDFRTCDLLITIGTSLKVQPFASLIDRVGDDVPRLLINLESVGEIDEFDTSSNSLFGGSYREEGFDFNGLTRGGKEYARDAKWLGEADKGIRELADALGWTEELEELFEKGRRDYESKEHLRTASTSAPPTPAKKSSASTKSEPAKATEEQKSSKQEQESKGKDASQGESDTKKEKEKESLQEIIKKEEEEEEKGILHAREEAEKIAKEIGGIADRPVDERRKEEVAKEEEEDFAKLAEEIEKLTVDRKDKQNHSSRILS